MKPVHLRPLAEDDLVKVARHYAQAGGTDLGSRAFDAALAALEPIRRMPSLGSPRLGQLCGIDGLRSWRVTGFPLQWLYFEATDRLDVVRLLADRQNILAILEDGVTDPTP